MLDHIRPHGLDFDDVILAMSASTPSETMAAAGVQVRVSPMAVSSPRRDSRNIVFVEDGTTASLSHCSLDRQSEILGYFRGM
jgi:hypothetical protein